MFNFKAFALAYNSHSSVVSSVVRLLLKPEPAGS